MEETKLDKFVSHIFNGTERFTNFVGNFLRKFSKNISFSLFAMLNGLAMITLSAINLGSKEKIAFGDITDFSLKLFLGLYCIYLGTSIIYRRIKEADDIDLKILRFSQKLYSEETTKFCFEPIIADWKAEYSQAAAQKRIWKPYQISIRYIYAFLSAIIQQSFLGKLFNILFKIGK